MGANGSSEIRVNFNNPTLVYYGGDQVSGTVDFQNNQDKLRLDYVFLDFTGELGYVSREPRQTIQGRQASRSGETEVRNHQISFLTNRYPVVWPQHGQNELTLYRGQHSWPFEFTVPEGLPPSSIPSTSLFPYVKYFVQIVIDKPWFKMNPKSVYSLIIFPRVNILQNPQENQIITFSEANRKKLKVEGSLTQQTIVPGQKIGLYFHLTNPKRAELKRVKVNFIQKRKIGLHEHYENIFSMDLPGLVEFSESEFNRTFEIQTPANLLAPTYSFTPIQYGAMLPVTYSYELQLEVKCRGLFTDYRIILPVIVGTHPNLNQLGSVIQYDHLPLPTAPAYEADELPPSYESIINNEKL